MHPLPYGISRLLHRLPLALDALSPCHSSRFLESGRVPLNPAGQIAQAFLANDSRTVRSARRVILTMAVRSHSKLWSTYRNDREF
jgi:hypothetical protein